MLSIEKPSLNDLYHFGVPGMKWGVRKERSINSTNNKKIETDEERTKRIRRNIMVGAAVVGATLAVAGAVYVYKKNNSFPSHVTEFRFGKIMDVNALSSKDESIAKGSKFYRMSSKSFEEYSEEGKRIYASHIKKDAKVYKHIMPAYFKDWANRGIISDDGKKAYEHVLVAKNDIKIPSKKFVAETYMRAIGENQIDEGHYTRFMQNLNNSQSPETKKFFEMIKASGYNAIVDENDAGKYAKMPLILLNPKNDIITSKVKMVGKMASIINVLTM